MRLSTPFFPFLEKNFSGEKKNAASAAWGLVGSSQLHERQRSFRVGHPHVTHEHVVTRRVAIGHVHGEVVGVGGGQEVVSGSSHC